MRISHLVWAPKSSFTLAALLAVAACSNQSTGGAASVGGTAAETVVAKSGQALTVDGNPATFQAVNGSYGAGCTARSGDWSLGFDGYVGSLQNEALSVVANNGTGCVLTVTSLSINGSVYSPSSPLALSAAYASSALTFSTSGAPFYANFKMTPDDFSGPFTISMFASDDVTLVPGTVSATYAIVTPPAAAASITPAPDYSIDTSDVAVTADNNQVVQTLTGNIVLNANNVTGGHYVIVTSAVDPMDTAAVDSAYQNGSAVAISGTPVDIASSSLGIDIGTTTLPATRSIIIENTVNAVTTYEVITVTFDAATN